MSDRNPTNVLRRAGNAAIHCPNVTPRPHEPGYRFVADAEITASPLRRWCEFYIAELAAAGVVGATAAMLHPAALALALLPAGRVAVSEAGRLTANARVRAQRVHADEQATNAAPASTAGRAVTA